MIGKALAVVAAGVGVLIALPLFALATASSSQHEPTGVAVDDIPGAYLALYLEAAALRCPGMPWSVLAGVGRIESNHGTAGGATLGAGGTVSPPIIGPALDGSSGLARIPDTDDGRWDGDTVWDRAVGPMQFIPSTWRTHGIDASGSGQADPHNAIDAIHSAAAYLCGHGAEDPSRVRGALFAYNRSWDYVDRVLYHAARYGWASASIVPASPEFIAVVLANPRLSIYDDGRHDIATGLIDARVLALLQLASQRHTLTIASLKTGHSRCVGGVDYEGCRVSHHWHGRAVDINRVDGRPVSRTNAAARDLARWLENLPHDLRPHEIGTPWSDLTGEGFFTDPSHSHHIHVGFLPSGPVDGPDAPR